MIISVETGGHYVTQIRCSVYPLGNYRWQAVLDRTRLGTPILTESVLLDLLPISGTGANTLREIQVSRGRIRSRCIG